MVVPNSTPQGQQDPRDEQEDFLPDQHRQIHRKPVADWLEKTLYEHMTQIGSIKQDVHVMRTELENKIEGVRTDLKELEITIRGAIPGGDAEKHLHEHELIGQREAQREKEEAQLAEEAADRAKFWKDFKRSVMTKALWGAIAVTGGIITLGMKAQLKIWLLDLLQ